MRVWLGGPKSTAEAGDLVQPNHRLLSHCVLDHSSTGWGAVKSGHAGYGEFEVLEGVRLDLLD